MSLRKSEIVKNRLREYCERENELPFERLNAEIDRSKVLAEFFVGEILPIKQFMDLIEDFEGGYVDGAGDGGCDVIIKKGDQVHIIQSKYTGGSKSLSPEDFDKWANIFLRLADPDKFNLKTKLKEIIREINWSNDKFYMWFVTNSKVDNNGKTIHELGFHIPDKLKDKGFNQEDQIFSELMDEPAIREQIENEADSLLQDNISFKFHPAKNENGDASIFVVENSKLRSAVLAVKANDLIDIFNRAGINLFNYNIRNPLGDVGKNKKIKVTAKEEPENFFFYNNGISAICNTLDTSKINSGYISGEGISIVNGAQTVRSLVSAGHDTSKNDLKVLMRITEMPSHGTKKDVLRKITEYNNTQNAILPSDFYSNEPIQLEWEKRVKNLACKRNAKPINYYRKRISKTDKQGISLELLAFMKLVYAFKGNPYKMESRGINSLFTQEKDAHGSTIESGYELVFGDINTITDSFIKERIGIYILALEFQQKVKALKKSASSGIEKVSLERGTVLVYLAGKLLDELDALGTLNKSKFLDGLVTTKGGWDFGEKDSIGEILEKLFETTLLFAREILGDLYPATITERQWQRGCTDVDKKISNLSKSAWVRLLSNEIIGIPATVKFK
jgi:ribosomal protein S16